MDDSKRMTLDERVEKGERAARWLDDEIGREVFEGMRHAILEAIESSPADARSFREVLYVQLRLWSRMRADALAIVEGGKLAAKTTRELRAMADVIKPDELR